MAEVELAQEFVGSSAQVSGGAARVQSGFDDGVDDGARRVELGVLEDESDAVGTKARACGVRECRAGASVDADVALGRGQHQAEDVEQGGFAASGLAGDHGDSPGREGVGEPCEEFVGAAPVSEAQVGDGEAAAALAGLREGVAVGAGDAGVAPPGVAANTWTWSPTLTPSTTATPSWEPRTLTVRGVRAPAWSTTTTVVVPSAWVDTAATGTPGPLTGGTSETRESRNSSWVPVGRVSHRRRVQRRNHRARSRTARQ